MQYHPKLKKAMAEIEEIIKKYDIGAYVILHTPGFAEYSLRVSPSYSCAWIEKNPDGSVLAVQVRNKLADYGGDREKWKQMAHDTVNLFQSLSSVGGPHFLWLLEITEDLENKLNAEQLPGSHTGLPEQGN